MQGSVANFVESEQLIVLEDKEGNFTTSSFVQIRGSIPLLWSQIPNIKYKPPTRIAPPSAYQPAFDRHFKSLLEAYQVTVCPCIVYPCCKPWMPHCSCFWLSNLLLTNHASLGWKYIRLLYLKALQ